MYPFAPVTRIVFANLLPFFLYLPCEFYHRNNSYFLVVRLPVWWGPAVATICFGLFFYDCEEVVRRGQQGIPGPLFF